MSTIALLVMEPRGNATVSSAEVDAVSVLIALGSKPQEASYAITAVPGGDLSSEEMVRQTLEGTVQVAPDDQA